MNRIILQLLALGFCFAVGQTLRCYSCKIGLGDLCITTEKTCKEGEHCYAGVGRAVGFMDIKRKGCLEVAKCNKTEEASIPGISNSTVYTMTKTCCDSDLCNAAPGLPSGLSLALASLTALFMAKILV